MGQWGVVGRGGGAHIGLSFKCDMSDVDKNGTVKQLDPGYKHVTPFFKNCIFDLAWRGGEGTSLFVVQM